MSRRLPAEWEKQWGVQITFPYKNTLWNEIDLIQVQKCLLEITYQISLREHVLLVCENILFIRNLIQNSELKFNINNIVFAEIPSNDIWARDHAPITVVIDDKPLLLDFAFNGWGLKYKSDLDNQINRKLKQLEIFEHNLETIGFVLEGGSIESDGDGTILTTSQCLLSPNRNPHLNRVSIEDKLKKYLGANRILFLNHGFIQGDDTDSHIDTLARFCNKNTICYLSCTDKNNIHYEELQKMQEELQSFNRMDGQKYNLIPLPLTDKPILDEDNNILPSTYCNFLIINSAVLVPIYNDIKDKEVLNIIQSIFPERDVVGIDCSSLIIQRGSLHCATMQFPNT